jgi:hypothetical protein
MTATLSWSLSHLGRLQRCTMVLVPDNEAFSCSDNVMTVGVSAGWQCTPDLLWCTIQSQGEEIRGPPLDGPAGPSTNVR